MQFPGPVRAMVGLLANAAEEAKHLPDRAIELPMLAVSTALQISLRAQQRYARLAARGDDVLNRRDPSDEPPAWATFDEPVALDDLTGGPRGDGAAEGTRAASELLDSLFGRSDDAPPSSNGAANPVAAVAPVKKAAAKAPAKKAAPAQKAGVKPAKKAATKDMPATTTVAKSAAAKKPAAPARPKSVSKPRHTTPSRFDDADDE
jgi:hypothetical protein